MYELRICAFVDILGFRSLVAETENDADLLDDVSTALAIISDAPMVLDDPHLRSIVRPVLETNAEKVIGTLIPGKSEFSVRGTSFSDSLVLSAEPTFGGCLNLLIALIMLTHNLLRMAYLVRGGVALGPVQHQSNHIFGPALIDAYDLETRAAVYPRVVFADSVYALLEEVEPEPGAISNFVAEDLDGLRFLDFLETPALRIASFQDNMTDYDWAGKRLQPVAARLTMLRDTIGSLVEALSTNELRMAAKYRWIASYLNRTLQTKEALLLKDVPLPRLDT